eukprot:s1087_g3.t1
METFCGLLLGFIEPLHWVNCSCQEKVERKKQEDDPPGQHRLVVEGKRVTCANVGCELDADKRNLYRYLREDEMLVGLLGSFLPWWCRWCSLLVFCSLVVLLWVVLPFLVSLVVLLGSFLPWFSKISLVVLLGSLLLGGVGSALGQDFVILFLGDLLHCCASLVGLVPLMRCSLVVMLSLVLPELSLKEEFSLLPWWSSLEVFFLAGVGGAACSFFAFGGPAELCFLGGAFLPYSSFKSAYFFSDLDEDLAHYVERLSSVWAPRVRDGTPAPHVPGPAGAGQLSTPHGDDEHRELWRSHSEDEVDLWLRRRRLLLDKRMFDDHSAKAIHQALLAVRSRVAAGPSWQKFSEAGEKCPCCGSRYEWMNTARSGKMRCHAMTNCRLCGLVVCVACASSRRALAKMGRCALPEQGIEGRICDRCAWRGPADLQQLFGQLQPPPRRSEIMFNFPGQGGVPPGMGSHSLAINPFALPPGMPGMQQQQQQQQQMAQAAARLPQQPPPAPEPPKPAPSNKTQEEP